MGEGAIQEGTESPTQTLVVLNFSLRISLTDKPTLKHLLLPSELGGVSRDERRAAVASAFPSVLSCSVLFPLLFSDSTKGVAGRVVSF